MLQKLDHKIKNRKILSSPFTYLATTIPFMQQQFDELIDSYLENEIGIHTHFLHPALIKGLQANILQLQKENLMFPAGIGNRGIKDDNQQMRGDQIYWMDAGHDNLFEQEFLQLATDFMLQMNRTCYTGMNDFEFHYAHYQTGTGYKPHTDQFANDNHRQFSLINYLNDDWEEKDGGALWAHAADGIQKISPDAGKTVLFNSETMLHEVKPSTRSRMSITGWLKQI